MIFNPFLTDSCLLSAGYKKELTVPQVWISKILELKIVNIFLPISLNLCFGCSKEPSHRDGSFEYPQHMFCLRNKKNHFQLRTLNWRSELDTKKN